MGLAFVPVYIRYLGIEAYGLIGIFAILQAWLTLLDMGMTPALSREMARFTAGGVDGQSIRDLLRSLEIIGVGIAGMVILGIWAASPWLATVWLKAEHLRPETVQHAVAAMGVVTGLRFVENIYSSSVVGLQRQVLQNVVTSAMATFRALGAIAVLAWISPSIEDFFIWQCFTSLITIPVLAAIVYGRFPKAGRRAEFSLNALSRVWRFAAGMLTISLMSLLLTQVDKILLSRLLSLKEFGYYALAGMLANNLFVFAAPVNGAFYPRFTELVTRDDGLALRRAYHQAAQLVTVIVGSAAVLSIFFGSRLIILWSGDAALAHNIAPLFCIMTAGTLLNALMGIPSEMQLAHGWTSLVIKVNIVAVALLIPSIFWVAPRFGAIGTAWLWVTLNAGYLIFVIYFMHKRILRTEKWYWYRADLGLPLLAASITAWIYRTIMPSDLGRLGDFFILLGATTCVLGAAALTAPTVRRNTSKIIQTQIMPMVKRT
jgi:O-antigen/teichoic acid export membrane protein